MRNKKAAQCALIASERLTIITMRACLTPAAKFLRAAPRLLRAPVVAPRALFTVSAARSAVSFPQVETFPVIQTDSDDSVTTPPSGIPDTLRVKLSSGDKDVLAGRDLAVVELIVPGVDGANLGILPGHEYTVSRVDAGVITLKTASATHRFVTAGGFVHANDNGSVIINTIASFAIDEIDLGLVKQELEAARQALSTGDKFQKSVSSSIRPSAVDLSLHAPSFPPLSLRHQALLGCPQGMHARVPSAMRSPPAGRPGHVPRATSPVPSASTAACYSNSNSVVATLLSDVMSSALRVAPLLPHSPQSPQGGRPRRHQDVRGDPRRPVSIHLLCWGVR